MTKSTAALYTGLALASAAMLMFAAGFICFELGLNLPATLVYALAGKLLLLTFVFLLIIGLVSVWAAFVRELRAYFCKESLALRRLLAMQAGKNHAERINVYKNRQLHYFKRVKRQKLQAANDRKHLYELYLGVYRELRAVKPNMLSRDYQSFRKALRKYHKQADAAAILALREQIKPCR
ncbi:MAG: hypothetical protein ABSB19_04470 [Methylomonas sp.]|jgi:hypothetical protein